LAISKKRKNEVLTQYETWIKEGKAVVLTEYTGLTMPAIDQLRARVREAGGEFHVIKNTLGKRAFDAAGLETPEEHFVGSTAMGIAFEDAPGLAKAIADFAKESEFVKIKGGFLGKEHMTASQVKMMADLPPLPVVRAQLLGVLSSPGTKLATLLAEPGRQLAQVIKAYADQSAEASAA
jgi:large subunit ribosomal protein L10